MSINKSFISVLDKCLFCNNDLRQLVISKKCQQCNAKFYSYFAEITVNTPSLNNSDYIIVEYYFSTKNLYIIKNNNIALEYHNINPDINLINKLISKYFKMSHFI